MEEKKGFDYIKFILVFTYTLWFISFIVAILTINMPEYRVEFRDRGRIIQGALYCAIGVLCLVMEILLVNLYRNRKKEVIKHLIGYFALTGFAVLLQGIFGIIEFTIRDFQTFWTDSSFIFLTGAIFCLGCFVFEVFKKGIEQESNQKHLKILLGACIISAILMQTNALWVVEVYVLILPVLVFVIYGIYIFYTLIHQSFRLRNRMESTIEKRAFGYIGFHGILLLCGGIAAVTYTLTEVFEIRYVSAGLLALAYYCLYKGFTLPMKENAPNVE